MALLAFEFVLVPLAAILIMDPTLLPKLVTLYRGAATVLLIVTTPSILELVKRMPGSSLVLPSS